MRPSISRDFNRCTSMGRNTLSRRSLERCCVIRRSNWPSTALIWQRSTASGRSSKVCRRGLAAFSSQSRTVQSQVKSCSTDVAFTDRWTIHCLSLSFQTLEHFAPLCVCVRVCVHTITLELIVLWPRYLECWFILTPSRSISGSRSQVKVHSRRWKMFLFRPRLHVSR